MVAPPCRVPIDVPMKSLNLPKWPAPRLEGRSVPDFIKIRPKPFQMKPTRA
ncbi:hypothetical protein COLO4_22807 [Corchorus olitorius]|uniref:Uncharacterized protein n=1 Tax=Corchorus olitorius TaxID=93759 RepID=A0A1R3IJU8_9ROSI|nr:hypothetical protein COLO4_22807 [Corchorus olitorius]